MRGGSLLKLLPALPVLCAVSAFAAPAGPTKFDGKWFVQAVSEVAACTTAIPPMPLPIAVENGKVRDFGILGEIIGASAEGSVDARGALIVSFSYAKDVFEVRGALKGDHGEGKWTSETLSCSGQWVAQRI